MYPFRVAPSLKFHPSLLLTRTRKRKFCGKNTNGWDYKIFHEAGVSKFSQPRCFQQFRTSAKQACTLWRNWFKLPPFCSQSVATLAGWQQRPERWRTEVLDFCTGSHKSPSFTRRKSRTSNNPVPVLRTPSKYGWMSCSLNDSNLNQLRHKLQPWREVRGRKLLKIYGSWKFIAGRVRYWIYRLPYASFIFNFH